MNNLTKENGITSLYENNPVYAGEKITLWMRGYTDDFKNEYINLCNGYESSDEDIKLLIAQLSELSGAYAFAIRANDSNKIYLFVDKLGLEIIYYSTEQIAQQWSFDLEQLVNQNNNKKFDAIGINEILLFRLLAERNTLFNNIKRVMPGETVCIASDGEIYSLNKPILRYNPTNHLQDEEEIIEQTSKFLDIYLSRLKNKNPRVGVFLSGGVDSSLLLAKAREHSFENLIAITCKFPGYENPELERAISVAKHLNVDHKIVEISDEIIKEYFHSITSKLECPLTYFNIFAREIMYQELSNHVDVVLTGQGADSMFGIDTKVSDNTLRFQKKRKLAEITPLGIRNHLANIVGKKQSRTLQRIVYILRNETISYLRDQGQMFPPGSGYQNIRAEDIFKNLSDTRKSYNHQLYLKYEPPFIPSPITFNFALQFTQDRALYTRNRHQVFCYSRLGAGYNIDTLHPFFSSEIINSGLTLNTKLRSDKLGDKPILKKLACRYLPPEIVYAPKMGFETPLIPWLQRNNKWWKKILASDSIANTKLFNENAIKKLEIHKDYDIILIAISLRIFTNLFDKNIDINA